MYLKAYQVFTSGIFPYGIFRCGWLQITETSKNKGLEKRTSVYNVNPGTTIFKATQSYVLKYTTNK